MLEQAFKRLKEEAEAASVLDLGFHMILNHDLNLLDGIPALVRQGVRSFKLFMTYKKRGRRMVSDEFICKVMERLAPLDGLCQLHCESGDVIAYLEDKAIADGRTAPRDFPPTCPDWTEEEAINRAILIGRMLDCPVYVVHLSTRLGLERIKRAQSEGQRVWTEPCRRPRPRRPLAGLGPGAHRLRGQRSLPAPAGAEGAGPAEYLPGPRQQGHPLRVSILGNFGAADVQRGCGQARPAADLAGARAG